jgi:hypothetical protein
MELCSYPEDLLDEPNLADDVTFRQPPHLPFADHVHGLVPSYGPDRPVHRPKPQTGGDSLLHEPMILLEHIIKVGYGPAAAMTAQFTVSL